MSLNLAHRPLSELCIGIISDTHMPQRWKAFPAGVFEAFRDVDLILHAGDVGNLWVLDELSQCAPVIAVHGNDETDEATRALPYQQLLILGGQRILLFHSHYPNRIDELESRKNDDWHPKLARWSAHAKAHGAKICIFGHIHIPFALEYEGVLLINPGAIASSGYHVRQTTQSVARLRFATDGVPSVEHINLSDPQKPVPSIDLNAGFKAAAQQFGELILTPDLAQHFHWLWQNLYVGNEERFLPILSELSHTAWDNPQKKISLADLLHTLNQHPLFTEEMRAKLRQVPDFAAYL